jgi:hypothetical protein
MDHLAPEVDGDFAQTIALMQGSDPQQLAQVVMAVHPGGVSNSALGHYMGPCRLLPYLEQAPLK